MKQYFKIIFVVVFNFCILSVFSQEYGYLLVNIIDTNKTVVRKGEQLVNLDERLNNAFKEFKVFSYKYACPKVKNEYLRRFAAIKCNCDVSELAKFLEELTLLNFCNS